MDNKKRKIESIYPLSFMQQGLLFHRLSNSIDQGLLSVEAILSGSINTGNFEKAWDTVVLRHEVMRSTIHWEKLEKPLQIVHPQKKVHLTHLDWQDKPKEIQDKDWKEFSQDRLIKGVDLNKGPLLNVYLIQTGTERYSLLWQVHHLLIDGWSSSIILQDVLKAYDAIEFNKVTVFETIPNHKSYLKWLSEKDPANAKEFWKSYFNEFKSPHFFGQKKGVPNQKSHAESSISVPIQTTEGIKEYCRQKKITVNTFLQGIWSLTLMRYFNTTDVVHGTTVSGRSSGFPNIHLMAGMYMNVQPIRSGVGTMDQTIADWLKDLQNRQQQAINYEYLGLDELISYAGLPLQNKLFDSLFVYENYPIVASDPNSIGISEFKSGLTSTFPVTMVAIPGNSLEFILSIDPEILDEKAAQWIIKTYRLIIESIITKKLNTYPELLSLVTPFDKDGHYREKPKEISTPEYTPPLRELEIQLTKLWEDVLGVPKVGVNDNFFHLGGDSLSAVQIIGKAYKLGIKIAPNQLFRHQTIAELSTALKAYEKPQKEYKHVEEIKTSGTKAPLFCLYAGLTHEFSYDRLANHVDKERPVYMVQISKLNETPKFHGSIQELAHDFIKEIKEIQPKGPYHILVYCWSTAVGLEISKLLSKKGEPTNFLIVDTKAKVQYLHPYIYKLNDYGKAIRKESFSTLIQSFGNKVKRSLIAKPTGNNDPIEETKAEKLRKNYTKIYKSYQWKPFAGDMTLILTNKQSKAWKTGIINSWGKLSKDKPELIYVDAEHHNLFLEPDVKTTTQILERCMTVFETKNE